VIAGGEERVERVLGVRDRVRPGERDRVEAERARLRDQRVLERSRIV